LGEKKNAFMLLAMHEVILFQI